MRDRDAECDEFLEFWIELAWGNCFFMQPGETADRTGQLLGELIRATIPSCLCRSGKFVLMTLTLSTTTLIN